MRLQQYESRTYSQQGEDGIIQHVFDRIGTTNKIAVEFGVTVGETTNTKLLAERGWTTYWFDALAPKEVPATCKFTEKFLTAENIVESFEEVGIPKQFDLLSIDVDSIDYYLRQALKDYSPRVCVMEYNGCRDGSEDYVMPYDLEYRWHFPDSTFGASLKSMTTQAKQLGYDLIYCESEGVNAFFVRKDVNVFPALTSEEAWIRVAWDR